MKQAQKLQKQMEKSQAELAATTFTGKSAQDLVVAELTGDKKVVNITFADAVVDPDDVETLQLALTRLWEATDVHVDWSRPVDYVKNGIRSLKDL